MGPANFQLFVFPIFIPNELTAISLSVRTTTNPVTPGTARIGIYNSGVDGEPSSLLLDAGTISYSAINTTYTITISQVLTPGWYWMGAVPQSGSASFNGYQTGSANQAVATQRSLNNISSFFGVTGYVTTGITGALPSNPTFSATSGLGIMVKVGF